MSDRLTELEAKINVFLDDLLIGEDDPEANARIMGAGAALAEMVEIAREAIFLIRDECKAQTEYGGELSAVSWMNRADDLLADLAVPKTP